MMMCRVAATMSEPSEIPKKARQTNLLGFVSPSQSPSPRALVEFDETTSPSSHKKLRTSPGYKSEQAIRDF